MRRFISVVSDKSRKQLSATPSMIRREWDPQEMNAMRTMRKKKKATRKIAIPKKALLRVILEKEESSEDIVTKIYGEKQFYPLLQRLSCASISYFLKINLIDIIRKIHVLWLISLLQ
jgi:hypothetical protein